MKNKNTETALNSNYLKSFHKEYVALAFLLGLLPFSIRFYGWLGAFHSALGREAMCWSNTLSAILLIYQ